MLKIDLYDTFPKDAEWAKNDNCKILGPCIDV